MSILRFIKAIKYISFRYLLSRSLVVNKSGVKIPCQVIIKRSRVIIRENTVISIDRGVRIINSRINITEGSSFSVRSSTVIDTTISVKGTFILNNHNIIREARIILEDSKLTVGNNNKLYCTIWGRFNSIAEIGEYNTINQGSEIRCDERVIIGSYNMISMNNRIWDTNTHRFFKTGEELKEFMISHYPLFNEDVKPLTKPIIIGDCNWIGEGCVLKSCSIGNHCILGTRTIAVNKNIPNDSSVVNQLDIRFLS